MSALLAITPMEAAVTLLLLAAFSVGVRRAVQQVNGIPLSANAALAMSLCALIGAMLFFGSWVTDGRMM